MSEMCMCVWVGGVHIQVTLMQVISGCWNRSSTVYRGVLIQGLE